MVTGDTGVAEGLTDIALGAASLGSQAGAFIADPVAALAAWGLDILLSLVTPLQDALDWVTGSPGDMEDAAGVADVVSGTSKDDLTWGITGWFFAGSYNRQVEDLKQLMTEAKSTVQLLADNIRQADEDWDGADAEIEQIFKEIELVVIVETPPPGC